MQALLQAFYLLDTANCIQTPQPSKGTLLKTQHMRLLLAFGLIMVCLTANAQGQSGTIKVRRPASLQYFVEIDSPPRLLPMPTNGSVRDHFHDGILRVNMPCESCNTPSAMAWLEIHLSVEGVVENARVTACPFPTLNDGLKAFAETNLRFEPVLIEGRKRVVQFAYPVLLITD